MGTKRALTKAAIARARETFLLSLADTCSISASAKKAGVSRQTLYEWKAADDEFAKAWDTALDKAADMLEDVAVARATKGTLKPVYQGGVKVGTIREHSDRLLEVLLKAHKPGKYRDKSDVNLSGSVSLVDLVLAARKTGEGQS